MNDLKAILYREFRLYVRQPSSIFLSLLMPLFYFFLYGIGMAKSGLVQQSNYLDYLLPGYVTMSAFTGVNVIIQGMFNERMQGMLTELLSCPVRVVAYVTAKIVFAATVASAQAAVLLAVVLGLYRGSAIFEAPVRFLYLIPILFTVSLLVASFIASIVGAARSIQTFLVIVNILNPVLIYASSIFYPVDRLPLWLQVLARINPLSWGAEALRSILTQGLSLYAAGLAGAAMLLLFTAVALNRRRIQSL